MADVKTLNGYDIKDATARSDISSLDTRVTALEQGGGGGAVSHIGMVIHSTTLDTEAKVIAIYGGTTWIQLSGYMLRGATTGVTPNSNTSDGGSDDAIVVSHSHTTPNHSHTFTGSSSTVTSGKGSAHSHGFGSGSFSGNGIASGNGSNTLGNGGTAQFGGCFSAGSTKSESSHTHSVTMTPSGTIGNASPTTNSTGSSGTNANLPKYKNVYIWERTA